tara:strand:+ start:1062 stop:1244 length:183 start_codon:yes stop_codon:yes gene_type:complete
MLFEELKKEFEGLSENYELFHEKNNKAAGARARKHANTLKKLLTPFKRETMEMAKKMTKK